MPNQALSHHTLLQTRCRTRGATYDGRPGRLQCLEPPIGLQTLVHGLERRDGALLEHKGDNGVVPRRRALEVRAAPGGRHLRGHHRTVLLHARRRGRVRATRV